VRGELLKAVHPFTARAAESVSAWGETRLIAAIRRWLGTASPRAPYGIGDDCAVLRPALRPQLLTVDSVIYGRHFDSRLPPRAAGAKLLKRNLSDLAAMGGRPTAAVVALCLDGRVRRRWLEGFYRGLAACARRHQVAIVGGDVAQTDGGFAASLTLLGTVAGPRALTRTGGRPGDHLYVTGVLGGSVRSGHHHDFQPRLAEGAWCARRPEVRAMIDLTDGLAKDAPALCSPGTAPALFAAALPRRQGASLAAALTEGEDYELAFAVGARADRPAFERAWRRAFPRVRLSWIGRLVRRPEMPPDALVLGDHRGYEHLRRAR
jgi:thiamine-monophosphate kinase